MKEHFLQKINNTWAEAIKVLGQCRLAEHKIVFTNGCFDILHPGHVQFLQEARDLGDFLVVAVNDDDSVRRLKGERRPILELDERMAMLAALGMVDMVVSFSEDTPLKVLQALSPDVLVKGGDYNMSEIVGAEEVIAAGGEVRVLSFKEDSSTTDIISRITKRYL